MRPSMPGRTAAPRRGRVAERSASPLPRRAAVFISVVIALAFALLSPACGQEGRTVFDGVFAPQEGLVASTERPFRDEICLNGRWDFQPVALPAGFQVFVQPPPPLPAARADAWEKTPIRIPSPWNVNSFARDSGQAGDFRCFPSYPRAWEDVYMAWMRRTVAVPAEWKGRRVRLRFEAVAGDTVVEVNGHRVAQHFDLFLPFEADVTAAIKPGETNEIRVGVRRPSLFNQVQGKMGYRPYPGGSFWGPHIAGIWQDVYLLAVPEVRVSDVFVRPLVDQDALEVVATVHNDGTAATRVALEGRVHPWMNRAGADPLSAPVPASSLGQPALALPSGEGVVPPGQSLPLRLRQKVGGALKHWTPDQPYLYSIALDLSAGGKGLDHRVTRFGWRQFKLAGKQPTLNGQPVQFKGDAWHFMGIPQMSRRYAWAWYRMVKDAGCNTVRLHAQPYPSFYLDVADEMGVMVLDETAIWASDGGPKVDSPEFWTRCAEHVKGLVLRDRNHPSVLGWSIENETWGVVRGVYRAPKAIEQQTLEQFAAWAAICRQADDTRDWISCDGDGDGQGRLPVAMVHYPDPRMVERLSRGTRPWGVGESGRGYDGTPRDVSAFNGERAYESFLGRMEGLAFEAFRLLGQQQAAGACYRSVFNLAWYGLQPLELGLRDTSRPPRDEDGVFFTRFEDGQPGVQPERLGPYCTTLNPGYDPRLPLYRPWPMFEAVRDGFTGKASSRWSQAPGPARDADPGPSGPAVSARVLGGAGSTLRSTLGKAGVSVPEARLDGPPPDLLVVDGLRPPAPGARALIDATLARGGSVFVWGASKESLAALGVLLPAPLALSSRQASSLIPVRSQQGKGSDEIVAGLRPSSLYFSESNPWLALDGGLAGPFVEGATVLLKACDTDWRRWNGVPEYLKTVSVLRSEREAAGSGVALACRAAGKGRVIVGKLDLPADHPGHRKIVARLLRNLGVR